MPELFIICPNTEKEVYTGLNMDWFAFDSYNLGEQSLVCPRCQETHTWTKDDVQLRSDGGEG